MLDFLLVIAMFAAGFWCGNKYGTLRAMIDEIMAKLPRRNVDDTRAGEKDK